MMYEVQVRYGYTSYPGAKQKVSFRKVHESRLSEYIRHCQYMNHYIVSVTRLYSMYPKLMTRTVRGIHIDEDETRL